MENVSKTKIIFMGTPAFAIPFLLALFDHYKVIAVITNPGETPVKKVAEQNKIPVFQPDKLEIGNWKLEIPDADLYIVAAYGKILPKTILDIPKFGSLNVHASLLPRWRGASPIQYALLNGDKKTGITIILMTEKVDRGPILAQKEVLIEQKDTSQTLNEKLAKLGSEFLIETIQNYLNKKIAPKEQNELEATYTKILTKDDGRIIWSKKAEEIERQIRAFDPWPSNFTFFKWQDKLIRIKILQVEIEKESDEMKKIPPGQIFIKEKKDLVIKTRVNLIKIKELQLEGGRPLKAQEFIHGYSDIVGQTLI